MTANGGDSIFGSSNCADSTVATVMCCVAEVAVACCGGCFGFDAQGSLSVHLKSQGDHSFSKLLEHSRKFFPIRALSLFLKSSCSGLDRSNPCPGIKSSFRSVESPLCLG